MTATWRIASGKLVPPSQPEPWMEVFDQVAQEWMANQPTSPTSGSTGPPVLHRFAPDDVRASALATARHFNLVGPRIATWSALPTSGTGGRMAVWRALALGWDLTVSPPSAHPSLPTVVESGDERFDFGVATPMQARHLLETNQLSRFRQLLLGGAPLHPGLERDLAEEGHRTGCRIQMGFGMTETLTHVATRSLGEAAYRPLPGVVISIDTDQSIVIDAPERGVKRFRTRDAGKWTSTSDPVGFHWLGRLDDVLNSGGIKVHPHEIERRIAPEIEAHIGSRRWYISGRKDEVMGDRITLIVEGEADAALTRNLLADCADLGNIRPRSVEFISCFEQTETGKVRRK